MFILKIYLLFSLLSFVLLIILNGIVSMLFPNIFNFHNTHWILGRLTGLYSLDFIFDISISALAIGFVLSARWLYYYKI
jgi:hypothetical protein